MCLTCTEHNRLCFATRKCHSTPVQCTSVIEDHKCKAHASCKLLQKQIHNKLIVSRGLVVWQGGYYDKGSTAGNLKKILAPQQQCVCVAGTRRQGDHRTVILLPADVLNSKAPSITHYTVLPHLAVAQVRNEKARRFLMNMRKKPRVNFEKYFVKADRGALRLLQRMLAFDPVERPTCEEALAGLIHSSLCD